MNIRKPNPSNCLNCGEPLNANDAFCKHCGQKTSTHRFSLKGIFSHDLVHSLFHLDKGFFLTLLNLFKQPGLVVQEYLNGKRVKYFNYFTMILLLIAFSHFLTINSPIKFTQLISVKKQAYSFTQNKNFDTLALIGTKKPSDSASLRLLKNKIDSIVLKQQRARSINDKVGDSSQLFLSKFEKFTRESPKLFYLLLLPIYTILTFLWFKRSKLNFAEHLILNIYKTCADITLSAVMIIGFYVYPKINFWTIVYPFMTLIMMAFGTWFYFNTFKRYYKELGIVFLKSLATVICVQVVIMIITMGLLIIYLIKSIN